MMNITSIPPAIWSPAPVSAVTAVTGVAPIQPVSRDTQTGPGASGRDAFSHAQVNRSGGAARAREGGRSESADPAGAVPLLPRESTDELQLPGSLDKTETTAELEQERQDQLAEEKAFRQQLQDVIANVWKASAAVVDMALGQQDATASDALTATSPRNTAAIGAPTGTRLAPQTTRTDPHGAPDPRLAQHVVAYDAQGHSSQAPQEAGALISRRV